MKKPKPHGGKRKGAGRKKGSKNTNPTAKGRTAITRGVSMAAPDWDRLDTLRGALSRGKYISGILPGLGV